MATGIVSIAALDHGYGVISDVLIALAAMALPVLIVAAVVTGRRQSWKLNLDVALALCTYVAACSVVAARLAGHRIVLWVLVGMALLGWLLLAPVVVRGMWRDRATLIDRARGGWELASVATSGLAILMADLKIVFLATTLWALAMCVYGLMTVLIVSRAVRDSSAPELVQPDVWILMGAAAIATLAGDHIHKAGMTQVWPVTVVTWIVATVWIPPLIFVALRRRIALAWAAVFPLGMYASATYATAVETGWHWLTTISLVFFWIAFAAWLIVVLHALSRIGSPPAPAAGTRRDLAT
jgi:tellurite resistance protein TehA-like permease